MNGDARQTNRLLAGIAVLATVVAIVATYYATRSTSFTCGGVDDTAAIQQALEDNTEVAILNQRCVIDSLKTVWIPSGRTIVATGSTFTEKPGCAPRCRLFETKSPSTDITFVDGEFIGDPANKTGLEWRIGIRVNDCTRFRMVGTHIRGFRFDALYVGGNAGSHHVTIERVLFEGNGRSHVSVARGSFITFRGGVYRNVVAMPGTNLPDPGAGINVEGNTGDYVTDVVVDGIEATGNVKGVVIIPGKGNMHERVDITNNKLVDNNLGGKGYGLIANSMQVGLIYNNRVSGSDLCMTIGGASESTRASGLNIARNIVSGCPNGLRLTGVKSSIVAANEHPGAIQYPALGVSGNMVFAGNIQR